MSQNFVCFCKAMTRSTWTLLLAILLSLVTVLWPKLFRFWKKVGILTVTSCGANRFCTSNPLSAVIESPGSVIARRFGCSTICLSLADPPYAPDTKLTKPPGVTPTSALAMFLFLQLDKVICWAAGIFGTYGNFCTIHYDSSGRKLHENPHVQKNPPLFESAINLFCVIANSGIKPVLLMQCTPWLQKCWISDWAQKVNFAGT